METPVSDVVDKAKAWWKSKTFIGIIIMVINPLFKLFGLDFDLGGTADVVLDEAGDIATQADSIWGGLVSLFGAVLAAWGRLKAKLPIKGFQST